ncbi:MAG: response regulator [Desulfobacteraceae bacterium]|jgi:DNA-binding response OmpR family regulator
MATKVLVLENTEGISELLTFSLSADYDVLTASNADEALSIISRENPPLLVFDIKDMDGIEFLCKIKKQSPQTEVIALSDIDRKDLGIASLKYDASDFIMKPVTGEALEIVLERAMRKLAIKKRLSPTSGDVYPSVVDTERMSAVKQVIDILSMSGVQTSCPGIIMSLQTKKGIILKTSEEYKKIFGNMEGKKSWEMFKRGTMQPEACPAAQAFKTRTPCVFETVLPLKSGEEIRARMYAAPLINQNDQADLVVETITIL